MKSRGRIPSFRRPTGIALRFAPIWWMDGRFSPFLFSLQPGGEIDFKGPYGAFILRRPVSDSLFVATGTGIAPFRSILQAKLREHADRRFTLIFGVRHEYGLLYHEEFLALARACPNFDYQPTLTRPPATGRAAQAAYSSTRWRCSASGAIWTFTSAACAKWWTICGRS